MWNGICSLCQSHRVYAKHNVLGTAAGWRYLDLKLVGGAVFDPEPIDVVTYICVQCGHIALTVLNTTLPGLEENLVQWGWSAIPVVDPDGSHH